MNHAGEKVLPSERVWMMDLWEAEPKTAIAGAIDQRLLRLHGWLKRSGLIYWIRKGAGSSILAFEFF